MRKTYFDPVVIFLLALCFLSIVGCKSTGTTTAPRR